MCLGLLDNLLSVLNILGTYSRLLNADSSHGPDDPGQGVVSPEGLAQVQASPHVASPCLLATAQPPLLPLPSASPAAAEAPARHLLPSVQL